MFTQILLNNQRVPLETTNKITDLFESIEQTLNLTSREFYLTQNGKKLTRNDDIILKECPIHIHLRQIGGKGGFGSMLRAIGAQIEKTTNREACRDLSGRRLRDINEEKQLKTWLEKQKEREEDAAVKTAKKIQKLQAQPKHEFQDDDYFNERSNLEQTVSDALEEGLKQASTSKSSKTSSSGNTSGDSTEMEKKASDDQASGSGIKRKSATKSVELKKKKKKTQIKGAMWIDADISSSSDSSDADESDEEFTKPTKTAIEILN